MTFRIQGPRSYFTDNQGSPLAAGTVEAYEAGTSTPKDTYTDSVKTTTNTNPIVLDAAGSAAIYLDGLYKIIVKDSAGNTVYTQDNVSTPLTEAEVQALVAAATSTPSYPELTTAAAATIDADTLRVYVNGYASSLDGGAGHYKRVDTQPAHELRFRSVDRYDSNGAEDLTNGGWWEIDETVIDARMGGYKADGLTASAAGNATALGYIENYLADKAGGRVHIPPGTAHMNAAWAIGATGNVTVEAAGAVFDLTQATATAGVTISTAGRVEINGLKVQNADSHGIHVTGAATRLRLQGVRATANGGSGLYLAGGTDVRLERCEMDTNTANGLTADGTTQHQRLTLINCDLHDNTADGFNVVNLMGLHIDTCKTDTNGNDGGYLANIAAAKIDGLDSNGNTGSGLKLEATDALNTAHDIDNLSLVVASYSAGGNSVDAMAFEVVTSGSGTINLVIVGASDTGATTSISVTGSGETITIIDGNFSGATPTDAVTIVGSGLIFLNKTVVGSAVAAIDFDGALIDATKYDGYEIELANILPSTDDDELRMRVSNDGGTSYRAGPSDYEHVSQVQATSGTAPTVPFSTGATFGLIAGTPTAGIGTAAGEEGASGKIRVHSPGNSDKTQITFELAWKRSDGFLNKQTGTFEVTTAEANDGFRLLMSTGNIASGTAILRGYKNA